jgi:GDP-mannose 4,6-dehydratase
MNFLVTGITGFAGPHLAQQLMQDGHTVFGLVRHSNGRETDLLDIMTEDELSKINWVYSDLVDALGIDKIFKDNTFDGVFHLAAQSHPPTSFKFPQATYETNVMGTINLIESMRNHQSSDCIFHFCSTSEVYGDQGKDIGVLEETLNLKPCNPYGASKAAMDLYVQERIQNNKMNGFITRAFSHTGPRRGKNFSISSDAFQIAKMMKGMTKDNILNIGNLQTERVVMDVKDCVNAYRLLMYKRASGVYNVCGDTVHKMQHFTDILIKHSGLDDVVQQIYAPFYRPIDIAVQIGDSSKLKKDTGWEASIDIEDTLKDLLQYWLRKI